MNLKLDYTNLLKNKFLPNNMTTAQLLNLQKKIDYAHMELMNDFRDDVLGFLSLPEKNITDIQNFVMETASYEAMVVLGIGGSALGNKALYSALRTPSKLKKKIIVIDNVDPVFMYEMLEDINWDKTLFNVITKSGTTAETMASFMIVLDLLHKKAENPKEQIIITTDEVKGFLRKVIQKEGYRSFIVPDNVGGRFSILSDVGLVSSAFAGIDIQQLLEGAKAMREHCKTTNIFQNPAYLNAVLHYWYLQQGYNISVMMPYANGLYDFADWYRQLWAESIGKRKDNFGADVYVGQTPVKALGTTDQHSQVQLYTEGPNDKIITFITVEKFALNYAIPDLYTDREEVNYLCEKSLEELINAERLATEIACTSAARPNANLIFPEINEFTIGQFIMMYEIQTVFMGKLLEINPLDQPGVEAGKIATYAMMGKKGFSNDLKSVNSYKNYKEKIGHVV
jgi:glucose-6-phosphate isomerase